MISIDIKRYSGGFFLFLLLASIVLALYVVKSFLFLILTSGVLAIITYPVYRWLLNRKGFAGRKSLASFLTCAFIVLVIIIPAIFIIFQVAAQSIDVYDSLNSKLHDEAVVNKYMESLVSLKDKYASNIDLSSPDINNGLMAAAQKVSGFLVSNAAAILGNIAAFIAKFFITLFLVYYLLIDGPSLLKWLEHLSPLPSKHEEMIFNKFKDVVESAFLGSFLVALIQGTLGGIGFAICGLPAFFWGVVMAFFSLIPMVGTVIIWLPAALYLLFSGSIAKGIFLLIWGAAVVGSIDNFLRPYFMKDKMALHPAVIFFAILGGVGTFGLLGIIMGPLAIAMCLVFIKVYSEEAEEQLLKLDHD